MSGVGRAHRRGSSRAWECFSLTELSLAESNVHVGGGGQVDRVLRDRYSPLAIFIFLWSIGWTEGHQSQSLRIQSHPGGQQSSSNLPHEELEPSESPSPSAPRGCGESEFQSRAIHPGPRLLILGTAQVDLRKSDGKFPGTGIVNYGPTWAEHGLPACKHRSRCCRCCLWLWRLPGALLGGGAPT